MFPRLVDIVRYKCNYRQFLALWTLVVYQKIRTVKFHKYLHTSPFIGAGIWAKQEAGNFTKKEVLIAKADALFDQGKYDEIYQLLKTYKDTIEIELLWRLSRSLYKMSETASEVEAKKLIYESYDLISKALTINENHFAVHKWMAVLLNKKSEYEGMKERIKQLVNVKNHMLKAAELNPNDATTLYMLGNWCYSVSDLNWYQRKIASALFATPPESSFEEALMYFEKAESVEPMFYSCNLLMLGKACLKLKKKDDAVNYLKQAVDYKAQNDEDLKAKQEAAKLLTNI